MHCYRYDLDELYYLKTVSPVTWVVSNNGMLRALALLASNGLVVRTATGTLAARQIALPSAGGGLQGTNLDGVAGNPSLALADDVAALEALNSTGFARRTGVSTWDTRTPNQLKSDLQLHGFNGVRATGTVGVSLGQIGSLFVCDTSSGNVVLNLPSASAVMDATSGTAGGMLSFSRLVSGGTVTINASGSDYFTEAGVSATLASLSLNGPAGSSITIMARNSTDGPKWTVVSRSEPRLFGRCSTKSTNFSFDSSDQGTVFEVSSTVTATMPLLSSLDHTFASVMVRNVGIGVVTLAPSGGDAIEGSSSYQLQPYDACILYRNGVEWRVFRTGGGGGSGGGDSSLLSSGY